MHEKIELEIVDQIRTKALNIVKNNTFKSRKAKEGEVGTYYKGMNRKMVRCPTCGKEPPALKPIKEWDLSPKVHVRLFECCGKKFREYIKK